MPGKLPYASEGTVASERNGSNVFVKPFVPEPTQFTEATDVKKPNMGQAVAIEKLTSDQESYTGPAEGFFAKFGSDKTE